MIKITNITTFLFLFLCLLGTISAASAAHTRRVSETVEDAARLARELIRETGIGTLMTTMEPSVRPEFAGYPVGLMDYYSDECPSTGDLILLITDLQLNARNFIADPHVGFTVRKLDVHGSQMEEKRVALVGLISRTEDDEYEKVKNCFVAKHPETKRWLPRRKNPFHDFHFYRLKVEGIYYVGGFGGLHYIGWVPEKTYRSARVGGDRLEDEERSVLRLQAEGF